MGVGVASTSLAPVFAAPILHGGWWSRCRKSRRFLSSSLTRGREEKIFLGVTVYSSSVTTRGIPGIWIARGGAVKRPDDCPEPGASVTDVQVSWEKKDFILRVVSWREFSFNRTVRAGICGKMQMHCCARTDHPSNGGQGATVGRDGTGEHSGRWSVIEAVGLDQGRDGTGCQQEQGSARAGGIDTRTGTGAVFPIWGVHPGDPPYARSLRFCN
ncbi:hypothetical protein SCHPADRAFT_577734 [Schizopora paradoxa]|uniref:Uncharacterized protein n=1 Tax=Schizopora paradoxa TaxID=27342 RepID=A0A0H2RCD1_9AGAM|nr:hypothetical protein SCHPADRAFT_577734 [Schizopora paradoxa]